MPRVTQYATCLEIPKNIAACQNESSKKVYTASGPHHLLLVDWGLMTSNRTPAVFLEGRSFRVAAAIADGEGGSSEEGVARLLEELCSRGPESGSEPSNP